MAKLDPRIGGRGKGGHQLKGKRPTNVLFLVLIYVAFILFWPQYSMIAVPPFDELMVVEGRVTNIKAASSDNVWVLLIRMAEDTNQFSLVCDPKAHSLCETTQPELTTSAQIKIWYGGEKYRHWWGDRRPRIWQLEKDGRLLRTYDEAVTLRDKHPWD